MSTAPSEPIRILLFEDNSSDAGLITRALERATTDYEIQTAARLDEGLEQIGSGNFDGILLDLSLPDSKGLASLEKVRASKTEAFIIVLIPPGDEDLAVIAVRSGARDYLLKDQLSGELIRRSIDYVTDRQKLIRKLDDYASALDHRQALLRKIFDINSDAMLILNRKYVIQFLNTAAALLLEADEASLIGETFPFEVNTTQPTELEIPEANGGSRLVEVGASDLLWEGERAILVVLHDITRQRSSELALLREKERLAVTLDSIADAVIATDSSGAVERVNQEACKLTGVSHQEALGKPLSQVISLKSRKTGEFIVDPAIDLLDPILAENLAKEECLLVHKDSNTTFLVSVEMRCIDDEEGQQHGCVTVLRDITKQKRNEEELFKQEKLNSISLLASGIAHDFNNMLTAILGNISVARMEMPETDKKAERLLAAENAALQAKSLTHQLLTFSKGGAPSLKTTTIQQVVEETAQFVLRGSNVKCEIEKEDGLWSVDADRGQISQVVNNLIINADQAMPSGGFITLRLRNCHLCHSEVPELDPGDYVCIEVADQGIGISPGNMQRIFDPYFTTKEDGNGLGLASSYSIIKSHRGAMKVESELGQGTRFFVYLPKAKKAEKAAVRTKQTPRNREPEKLHRGRGRILVMDDLEAMMMVAGEILNALGYEVAFATDGEEAIEAYKRAKESGDPFDAVVFDLTVPGGMGGEEASNILINYDPGLVAIASSGYTTSDVMTNYKKSAFKAVVPKPYRIKEMSDALKHALQKEK